MRAAAHTAVSLKFHYEASESSNTVYHLACLAGNIPCTKSVFERFWHDKLQWTPADQIELDAWTGILKKAGDAAPPAKSAPYIGNTASLYPSVDAQHQVIRAALEASSLSDFQRRTRQWLSRDEASRLRKAIWHFRGRLKPRWQATSRNTVRVHQRQVEKSLASYKLLSSQVAAFVEADLPTREVYIHAIPGPVPESDAATATQVSNHIFIELTAAATQDSITSVSMHELTHYFYDTAPASEHFALMQQFVQSESPHGSALYAFLNEALACAVQGLITERTPKSNEGKSDDDGYRHPFIPRLGRSTVPVLKESLANGSTLYQGFSRPYMREGTANSGATLPIPSSS